ncbi:unnamed protein product, partial [Musa hybrid cultivar]
MCCISKSKLSRFDLNYWISLLSYGLFIMSDTCDASKQTRHKFKNNRSSWMSSHNNNRGTVVAWVSILEGVL